MAKELAKLFVTIGLDDAEFGKKLNSIQKSLTQAGKMMTGIGVGITAALGLSVKAAEAERISEERLASVLQNVGVAYDTVRDSLNANMQATMKKTGTSDDNQRAALSELILITGDYQKALELLPTALDLAAAKQIDASTAAELLGKVAEGNFSTLARYGIVLKEGATASEALAAIQEKVAGAAEKMASPIDKLKNSFSDLQEKIGSKLLPVLSNIVEKIMPVIERIGDWIDKNPKLATTLLTIAAAIGGLMAPLGMLLMMLPAIAAGFTLMLGPVGLIIAGVAALAAIIVGLSLIWSKKSKDMTKTTEDEAQKQIAALEHLAASAKVNTDKEIDALRKKYGVIKDFGKEENKTYMGLAREASKAREKAIGEELEQIRDAHDEKIRLYNEEYDAKIRSLNGETDLAIRKIQDQIDAIDDQAQAERDAETEAELRKALSEAKKSEDKKAAQKALDDFLKEQSRNTQKEVLQAEIDAIRESADDKKLILDAEFNNKILQETNLYNATKTRLDTEKENLDTALQEELVRLEIERQAYEDTQNAMLAALQDRLDKEKALLNQSRGLTPSGEIPLLPPEPSPWSRKGGPKLHFDIGGIVPGPIGQPYPAIVHGGEVISRPGSQASIDRMVADAIQRGLAGMKVIVNVGGKEVAAVVSREQFRMQQMRT